MAGGSVVAIVALSHGGRGLPISSPDCALAGSPVRVQVKILASVEGVLQGEWVGNAISKQQSEGSALSC